MAFGYKDYTESDAVAEARRRAEEARNNKPMSWKGGHYGQTLNNILDQINNREKFSYDLNGDALYNQYKNQYMRQGKLAMLDTMGQASAMTGGYGSSYAETVGNQAYQGYLQQLNDVVPQLYQMAYDRYNQEGQDMYNRFNATQSMYNNEYGIYRDNMNDWYTDRDYYTNLYNDERSWDYGLYSDAYNRALQEYQLNKSGGGSTRRKKTTGGDDDVDNEALNKAKNNIGSSIANALKTGNYSTQADVVKMIKSYVNSYGQNLNDATYSELLKFFAKKYGF